MDGGHHGLRLPSRGSEDAELGMRQGAHRSERMQARNVRIGPRVQSARYRKQEFERTDLGVAHRAVALLHDEAAVHQSFAEGLFGWMVLGVSSLIHRQSGKSLTFGSDRTVGTSSGTSLALASDRTGRFHTFGTRSGRDGQMHEPMVDFDSISVDTERVGGNA